MSRISLNAEQEEELRSKDYVWKKKLTFMGRIIECGLKRLREQGGNGYGEETKEHYWANV